MTPWPVVRLMGPTASGKSALAMMLAEQFPIEIISVDSGQVYRGMDIGTAKPSQRDQQRVAHHLIDLLDPAESYSAARFVEDAEAAINAVQARGHLPLLVGGTMLYFRALAGELAPLPDADAAIRSQLSGEAAAHGWPALHARLAKVDPSAAKRIHPNDPQRIQRALEVYLISARPISELQAEGGRNVIAASGESPAFALLPEQRAWLHRRIEQRFDQMLAQGFMDEARALHARAKLPRTLPALRSVGYRQALEYLDQGENASAEQFRSQAIAATRQLAKRQLTWLRSMPGNVPLACDRLSREQMAASIASRIRAVRPESR